LGPRRARFGRLGQMHLGADGAQLLDDEPPARRRLQRSIDLLALKAGQEATERQPVGRPDAPAPELARHGVEHTGDLLKLLMNAARIIRT